MVAVAGADVERLSIPRQNYATRALTDGDRLHRGEGSAVDHGDRIVLLVRDVDGIRHRDPDGAKGGERRRRYGQPIRHFVSGLSTPSVSSSENWCRNPGCGDTDTRERASASRMGWRSWPSHDRKLSRAPLKAASSKRSLRRNGAIVAGSVEFDRAAASPIARTAIQAA